MQSRWSRAERVKAAAEVRRLQRAGQQLQPQPQPRTRRRRRPPVITRLRQPPPVEEQKAVAPGKISVSTDNIYLFACPHCQGAVEVRKDQLNCMVFRHATLIATGAPINPHASKEECERLIAEGKIRGCGKPFRFDGGNATKAGYDT